MSQTSHILWLIFCFLVQIKSVLIQLFAKPGDAVLDLACGKVLKWFYIFKWLNMHSQWAFPCKPYIRRYYKILFFFFLVSLWLKQGGDLIKWDKAKIAYYVGVDIAEGSVKFCYVLNHTAEDLFSIYCCCPWA